MSAQEQARYDFLKKKISIGKNLTDQDITEYQALEKKCKKFLRQRSTRMKSFLIGQLLDKINPI